ncbi:unnamed protein product [Bursaphelenchus okinawaensis]|uniref:Carboxylesterase type B domain-containing protein n=1 Tax=Bursaphelenchus okinawaensis TaxID=465554 RepID=A0A811JTI2_9BILA|nr:unnamed protein product [Bursaphelenchus okinawaensis]CAG9082225.1 unnamed protein product [Bursaphelenchus okinawaensis]
MLDVLRLVAVVVWLLPPLSARNPRQNDHLIVQTALGTLKGVGQSFNGQNVRAFLGVPYAKKPTGSRRFALPEMVGPWEGDAGAGAFQDLLLHHRHHVPPVPRGRDVEPAQRAERGLSHVECVGT